MNKFSLKLLTVAFWLLNCFVAAAQFQNPPTLEVLETTSYSVKVKFTDRSYEDRSYELYVEEPYYITYSESFVMADSGQSRIFTIDTYPPGTRVTISADVWTDKDYPERVASVTVETPLETPEVKFLGNSSKSIYLRLTSGNEGDVELERSTSPTTGFQVIKKFIAETEGSFNEVYKDVNVAPNTTYYYRMRNVYDNESSPYSPVASATTVSPCGNSGSIKAEVWRDVPGVNVSDIPVNSPPSSYTTLSSFQSTPSQGSNYGQRIRAFFCPPVSSDYVFYISSDDKSELWLSSDDNPANKVRIASVPGFTAQNQFDKYPSQTSQTISLERGRKYYIEALHKEGSGSDHLTVGMWIVGVDREFPISGSHLSPYTEAPAQVCEGNGSLKWEIWNGRTGTTIDYALLNTAPDQTITLTKFESPQNFGTSYQSRAAAYICPPVTGSYTFWIASDDRSDLWLSTSDRPEDKVKIASVTGYAPYGTWEKYATQKSVKISLTAGQRYYIEAVHKEGSGADYVAVGWQLPNGVLERPIQGNRLSPANVSAPPVSCAEEDGGYIEREIWRNISGTSVSTIPVNSEPNQIVRLTSFATGTYFANDYGSRIRGYICVPVSGNYTFWISSDDNSELWLSTNATPSGKVKIASVTSATRVQEWEKYPSQRSAPIRLQAGYKYYIEALHKEGTGNDHVAVGWQLPNGTMERPIAGNRLIPFTAESRTFATAFSDPELVEQDNFSNALTLSPNPVTDGHVSLKVDETNAATLENAEVTVVSMAGEVIFNQKVKCAGNCSDYPLSFRSDLEPGIYMVNVIQNGKRLSKKLIVK